MRKSILLALGIAAMSLAGAVTADAAVKTYWDQATGQVDEVRHQCSPACSRSTTDQGDTTGMGKVQAYKGGSSIPRKTVDYDGPFRPTAPSSSAPRSGASTTFIPDGKALKYGVGVGREGFPRVGRRTDFAQGRVAWLDAAPEMIAREKKKGRILPAYMEGGPNNPLGARAMYIGGTLYRIHGSNEPWTMGRRSRPAASALTNEDVAHLYERVKIGTRVVVLRGDESPARLAAAGQSPAAEEGDPGRGRPGSRTIALPASASGSASPCAGTVPGRRRGRGRGRPASLPVEPVSAPPPRRRRRRS